ncbi:MAG: hypothetical protein NTX00_04885 [Candidatus Parcubacteria bacterium]|nr:hypothetical protein [Candidatus Parcubacteria bacterium]
MTFLPISWFPSFYDVRYSGWSMIAGALIIYFLPSILRVPANSLDAARKNRAADLFQFLIAFAIIADALGALGLYTLYQFGIPYAYILHLGTPLISVILLSIIINARFKIRLAYATGIAFILVLICGIGWEIFENTSDRFLGTHLTGPDQLTSQNVTVLNLIQDTIGATLGSVIVVLRQRLLDKNNQT